MGQADFDLDDGNVEQFAEHGVNPSEAVDVILDHKRLVVGARSMQGEERWIALGATEAGRVLRVVFTRRRGRIRIVTAYDATERERRTYRRRKN